MAQFEPGHLHIERHALGKGDHSYNLCIDYEVLDDPKEGKGMQFRLHGSVEGKDIELQATSYKLQATSYKLEARS